MNKFYFFGIIGTSFGAWAKITHQSYTDTAITVGLICRAVGIAALVWFLFMWLKKKN